MTFTQFDSFFNILILVTIISLLTWRLKFPPTLGFIIAGVLASLSTRMELPTLNPEIFLSILLPPILFQEALHLEIDGLIDEADSVITFAILGTLLMQLFVALFSWVLLDFSVLEALLFGILIAPTDPVAVIRVFHSLGVQRRFRIIVSGESLFNDGVSIVVYSILVTIAVIGDITPYIMGIMSLGIVFGGIIIGLISGYLVHSIFCWTDDKFPEVLVSFIAAFGVFRIAEELHTSGVLAVVVAGLIINYRTGIYGGFSKESYDMLEALWEFIGFLASSIAFIFIGMNLDQNVFRSNIIRSLILMFLVIALRFIIVESLCSVLAKYRKKDFSNEWRGGFVWSGLRGAVSIVLVLGVSGLLPNSDLMIALTFGVVILSNVLQGVTMGWVVRSQGLSIGLSEVNDTSMHEARLSEYYNLAGYPANRSKFEKLMFSAPEYFINETKFGNWISNIIISVLALMNRYLVKQMTTTTKSIFINAIKFVINTLSNLLTMINRYRSNKELNGTIKKSKNM